MIKACLIFTVLLCLPFESNAQYVTSVDGAPKESIDKLFTVYVRSYLASLDAEQRTIAESIEIRVVRGGPWPGPMAGFDKNGHRIINIPVMFDALLREYAVAYMISQVTGLAHFAEWWINYELWRSPVIYTGEVPKRPLDYFGYAKEKQDEFIGRYGATIDGIYVAAMTDVLLHEIGHHVINEFYDLRNTDSNEAQKAEIRVDQWAQNVIKGFSAKYPNIGLIDRSNLMGRLISMLFLQELGSFSSTADVQKSPTHPENYARLREALKNSQCTADSPEMKKLCEFAYNVAEEMSKGVRDENHYRMRADNGETYTKFKLGLMTLRHGHLQESCHYMEDVLAAGGEKRALVYLGGCFEQKVLGKDISDDDRYKIANAVYCRAAQIGWIDAKKFLDRLNQRLGRKEVCD